MAVGKGSMDRASKAAKNKEAKNSKINLAEEINYEGQNREEKVNHKKTENIEQKQKVSAQKMKTGTTRKNTISMKKQEKNSSNQEVKTKKTEEKETLDRSLNFICGIGDEMPIYFL